MAAHGRFKARLLELEDSIDHALDHESVCTLVNEAKKDFYALIELYKRLWYSTEELQAVILKWFGEQ